eukprot:TRINITY_DN84_c0_g1_i6.p2 TRINITY_DN84_c0_g1~~TRINITY_DN84_c0_g1_i6.p2  ORF type:complete len:254 (+),score=16.32 TRINITY_DN84_c0_g1_i6:797-1558(+)
MNNNMNNSNNNEIDSWDELTLFSQIYGSNQQNFQQQSNINTQQNFQQQSNINTQQNFQQQSNINTQQSFQQQSNIDTQQSFQQQSNIDQNILQNNNYNNSFRVSNTKRKRTKKNHIEQMLSENNFQTQNSSSPNKSFELDMKYQKGQKTNIEKFRIIQQEAKQYGIFDRSDTQIANKYDQIKSANTAVSDYKRNSTGQKPFFELTPKEQKQFGSKFHVSQAVFNILNTTWQTKKKCQSRSYIRSWGIQRRLNY